MMSAWIMGVFCWDVLVLPGLLRMEAFLAAGPSVLWCWICPLAWMQTASEWLHESMR